MDKAGKILIVIAFLISVITFYWVILMIPLFLIGVILVALGKKTKLFNKFLWSILPVIFWYPTTMGLMFAFGFIGEATAQKIDFIIKEGKLKSITLIDNMPCGRPVIIENGREQIVLTDDIINLYQGNLEYGYINHDYYFETKNGEKVKGINNNFDIEFSFIDDSLKQSKIILRSMGMGTVKMETSIKYHEQTFNIIYPEKSEETKMNSFAKRDSINTLIKECFK